MTRRRGGRAWREARAHFLATTDETNCWLCGHHVDRTLPGNHRWGPTADHLVSLMDGGLELPEHGAVLRLAHNRCNAARSNTARARTGLRPLGATGHASREW